MQGPEGSKRVDPASPVARDGGSVAASEGVGELPYGAPRLVASGRTATTRSARDAWGSGPTQTRAQVALVAAGKNFAELVAADIDLPQVTQEERPGPSLAGAYGGVAVLESESKLLRRRAVDSGLPAPALAQLIWHILTCRIPKWLARF